MNKKTENADTAGFGAAVNRTQGHGRMRAAIMVALATTMLAAGPHASAASHDIEWVFGDDGLTVYRLNSYAPASANLGVIGAGNPTIPLVLGKRYQVRVINYVAHPLEIIAKGANSAQDVLLLRQGGAVGPFESDPQVNWTDNGAGTVTFTVTMDLYSDMTASGRNPGYRCASHATTMRGDFTVAGIPIAETIAKGDITIELETVASGIPSPVDLKSFPDGSGRLAVVDQAGKVHILVGGGLLATPFLDVSPRLVSPLGIIGSHDENDFDERGLLGLAFHADFADPGKPGYRRLFTYTSEPVSGPADFTTDPPPTTVNHQSVVAEWRVNTLNPDTVDTTSRREILRINQPQFNHNGGMLAFGPDGYLYISLGDGGAGNDVGDGHGASGNGQNKNTVHGSILRIDPLDPSMTTGSSDGPSANGRYRVPADNPFVGASGVDEIYAYGLRNPFRFSFDEATGRLIVGDVGQNRVEEIDIVVKGGNYGWNLKEGSFRFDPATGGVSTDLSGLPPDLIDPVAEYDHDDGISIIGGYVYTGTAIPELAGKYVFGDFSRSLGSPDGRLFYADLPTGQIVEFRIGPTDRDLGFFVKGFGIDAEGEVYVLASANLGPYGTGGVVLKIVDLCTSRLIGDVNRDCIVDFRDFALLAGDWLVSTAR